MTTTPTETDVALAEVRAYCGWIIAPSETVELTLDGSRGTTLQLPTLYMTALGSLSVCGTAVDVTSEHVEWSRSGFIRRAAGFGGQLRGVVVSITHGYDTMPLDVQVVIDRIAKLQSELEDASGLLSQVGGVRYAVGVDGLRNVPLIAESSAAVLDRYKLPPRP